MAGASEAAGAVRPVDPLGGQPPAGATASVEDFDYQVKYQRAFEAVLWALPAVAIYRFRAAAFDDLGVTNNDVLAYSAPATPLLEALTANSTTPYIAAYADLRNGPVVVEVPASGEKAVLFGQVVDAWQLTIAEVGPSGLDAGHGKYLFTPPGYEEALPEGYLHIASPNYRVAFAFRSIPTPGSTAQAAYEYAQTLRMMLASLGIDHGGGGDCRPASTIRRLDGKLSRAAAAAVLRA